MRATYEDLLQISRRRAAEAYNSASIDTSDPFAGWQATLTAARHHFRWLRHELPASDFMSADTSAAEGPLAVLARSIGAGGDLLASQTRSTRGAWDDEKGLGAAQAAMAAITDRAARAVVARLNPAQIHHDDASDRLSRHLTEVITQLRSLRKRESPDIGALRGLTTTLPPTAVDEPSHLILLAARWKSAHETTTPRGVLTRDLRSATAQLRTVIGYGLHLTARLGQRDATAEATRELVHALRVAGTGTQRLAHLWRTRLSDLNGRSEAPAESAFIELIGALRAWISDGERLTQPQDLLHDERSGAVVRDVIDELMNSADRVAKVQQETVAWLIRRGHLFVPRAELAKRDPEFALRPQVWRLRYPQPAWVRTNLAACFDEVTATLAEVTDHLCTAARTARRIAGTSDLSRPFGPEHFDSPPFPTVRVETPPVATRSPRGRYRPEYWNLIPEIYRDLEGLER
ncbi:hypothetical protein OHB24_21125 [Kribbella sp. NBC_00482]|uniref:hypothetical protein n=1 Tax=Kribbella sp. NBC_00482 TaxID=2975968 RepID=UPI002E190442